MHAEENGCFGRVLTRRSFCEDSDRIRCRRTDRFRRVYSIKNTNIRNTRTPQTTEIRIVMAHPTESGGP